MITIDQLLESVDLDFEPRWVTQDAAKHIEFWSEKPKAGIGSWRFDVEGTILSSIAARLKLAEFDSKDWKDCIYEVPRKTDEYEQNLENTRPVDSDLVYRVKLPRKTTGKIEKFDYPVSSPFYIEHHIIMDKINELVDAVNELKGGAKND